MLYLFFYFFVGHVWPVILAYAQAGLELSGYVLFFAAGICILFSSVGMRISQNAFSTCAGYVFRGVGFTVNLLVDGFIWLFQAFLRLIPRVYHGMDRTLRESTPLKAIWCHILALIITILVIVIII